MYRDPWRAGQRRPGPCIDAPCVGLCTARTIFFHVARGPRTTPDLRYTAAAVGPEIFIVGDRSHRGALIPRVQDLGYTVTPVRERELSGRVASSPAPAAVLVCLGETNASELVDAVRRGRDDVPVVLLGSLGGELRDLADVLELGADHFLAAPVGDEELARVLAELAGPGAPIVADADAVDAGVRGDLEDEDELDEELVRPLTGRLRGRDPVPGQLHRSLEMLAARLQDLPSHEAGDAEPDNLDLESLGLDATPDVDGELDPQEVGPLLTDPESSDPAAPQRPEPTQRISARPRGAPPVTDHEDSRGAMRGEDTQQLCDGAEAGHVRRDMGEFGGAPAVLPIEATDRIATGPVRRDRPVDRLRPAREPTERRGRSDPGETTARVLGRRADDPRPRDASGQVLARRTGDPRAGERGTPVHMRRAEDPRPRDGDGQVLARRIDDPPLRDLRPVLPNPPFDPRPTTARVTAGRRDIAPASGTTARVLEARPDGVTANSPRVDEPVRQANETTARLAPVRPEVAPASEVLVESLAGIEVVDRLWQLHATGFDGRLTVGFGDGARRTLWWRGGEPVYAASTTPSDGLVARLRARGLLARGQIPAAARLVDDALMPSARRLVQAGSLKPREQQEAVRDVVARIFEATCSETAVRWSIDAAPPPTEVSPDTSVLALLAAGARVGFGRELLHEQLPADQALRLIVDDLAGLARELGWPGAEDWLVLLDGTRTLAQLVAEDGLDERELWIAACVLTAAGLATPAEPDADAVLVAIDRRRIDERLALARASDYFALLGLDRNAGRAEVLRAHADLRGTFADERLEPRTREELADRLAELHAALDEARVVLLDEALRLAYTAHLPPEPGADPEPT